MTAVTVPGRWVDDPEFAMSDGTGNCGFCECGKPLVLSRYWIHADDVLAATAGMALGWCCPECCDRMYP